MASIDLWFPVAIYEEKNLFPFSKNEEWAEISLELQKSVPSAGQEWYGNTYTTINNHDISKDPRFEELKNEVTKHVNAFAKSHNSDEVYNCHAAWVNVNETGTFQEYHSHSNSVFSAIYYISSPPGSGSVVFEDPKEPDMLPLRGIKERNNLSYCVTKYPCEQGKLIIFRAYLRHLVQPGTNTRPRISAAFNFR